MKNLSGTPDKRRRRTKQQIEQLQKQIYEVLYQDHPQSVRHIFYRMTNPRLLEPVEKPIAFVGSNKRVFRRVMREKGVSLNAMVVRRPDARNQIAPVAA
jgi:urate oxidase